MRAYEVMFSAAIAALLLVGCGSSGPKLVVTAPKAANYNKPIYMLVRNVPDKATFSADTYRVMSAKVGVPDDTVVMTQVIYPETEPSFSLTEPKKGQLAVYFFFTTPAGEWKVLLDTPLAKSNKITLGRDRLEQP